ncbi:MAG: O-antigen ligase family protein [Verrucomicrobiota bacterium]|nr:O-antigen ligase family protein [Verrucomicrobiota bacterium]
MLSRLGTALLCCVAFILPFEHKYDKIFRYFSKTLIPENLHLPASFDPKIYFYPSDLIAIGLIVLLSVLYITKKLRISFESLWVYPKWFKNWHSGQRQSSQNVNSWTILGIYLLLLPLLLLLSLLFSPCHHYPLFYIRLTEWCMPLFLLFCFTFFYQTSEAREKATCAVLGAFLLSALLQASLGLAQYCQQEPLGLRILSEPAHLSSFLPANGGEKWIFDSPSPLRPLLRATGTLPHANVLGGLLAASLLVSYFFFTLTPRLRLLLSFAIPLQFFVMLLTYSRSALFGWFLATLFWFFYKKEKFSLWLIALILTSTAASCLILHEQLLSRGGVFNYNSPAKESDSMRLVYQEKALNTIKEHPFFGVGFGQLPLQSASQNHSEVHNIYLYLAAESGLPALLLFLLFLASLARQIFFSPPTPYLRTLASLLLLFLFIGGCDFYPLYSQQGRLFLFLSLALMLLHTQAKGSHRPLAGSYTFRE